MKRFLTAATVALSMTLGAGAASAATVFASSATIVQDGPRGTANNRNQISNALGANLGDFFELGFGGIVDFMFGQSFVGPGNVVEVTFNKPANHPESADIFVGNAGNPGSFQLVAQVSNTQAQGPQGQSFQFNGTFDTLRIADTTDVNGRRTGGFDVDRVSVNGSGLGSTAAPVPLPASALLLLAGIGGLGTMRLRRRAA